MHVTEMGCCERFLSLSLSLSEYPWKTAAINKNLPAHTHSEPVQRTLAAHTQSPLTFPGIYIFSATIQPTCLLPGVFHTAQLMSLKFPVEKTPKNKNIKKKKKPKQNKPQTKTKTKQNRSFKFLHLVVHNLQLSHTVNILLHLYNHSSRNIWIK